MKLAAVGSNCIDYYNNLDGGKAFPGGGPVNMAVYTVRLGGEAAYIGPVGNDSYGEIMMEAMKKNGYDEDFAGAVTAASSVIGPIFPPSIPLIIYGSVDKESLEIMKKECWKLTYSVMKIWILSKILM